MKKLLLALLLVALGVSSASATILPANGVDKGFKRWTGIDCTPAVVLCESLSVLNARGDQGGKKVTTLYYSGEIIPVIESWDGYAKIYYADGTKTGWVRNDYLLMDPAWYLCDEDTQVHAYPDAMAPCVALLDKGTQLPILTQWEDTENLAGWVCVSLRGAAGWICKTPKETAGESAAGSADPAVLEQLAVLLTNTRDQGGMVAGCPFTAMLTLLLEDGQKVELQLATDSCCVYRVDGRDYAYARNLADPDKGSPDNTVLFSLFGINPLGE